MTGNAGGTMTSAMGGPSLSGQAFFSAGSSTVAMGPAWPPILLVQCTIGT